MNIQLKYILPLILIIGYAISQDCDSEDPLWEDDLVVQDYEFSATIAAAQIWIDGIEQTSGKLAIFYEDEIRGIDSDGGLQFPVGDQPWLYEISVWSNQVEGENMSFKFYDDINDVIILLNETYNFISNDIVGDGFEPFQLTGTLGDCIDEDENHFGDVVDNTGISELIIFSNTISSLEIGDQIGIFDSNGLISDDCSNTTGEVLVGYGEWTGEQLEIVAISSIDFCDFGGMELPGFIEGNPIIVRVWDISDQIEQEAILTIEQGSSNFVETSFVVISEIDFIIDYGCIDELACNYDEDANTDDGSCEYSEENYDCYGNCIADIDCFGECGGNAVIDDCGVCDGNNADQDDCGVCFGNNEDQDCSGECFGNAVIDDCGECGGEGPSHQCWDGSIVCDPFECPDSNLPAPDLFSFNQSLSQAFYYISDVNINNIDIDSEDWVAAFNGDICVGSRKWDTSMCTNDICDIGVMGDDGSDATDGYMLTGELPLFKLYDSSEDVYYNAIPSENFSWESNGLFTIDNLNETDYYCDSNPSCSGCMDSNACNYDEDALISDTCYYLEINLLEPSNNEIIVLDEESDLEGNIDFSWSEINESCYNTDILYDLSIWDQNFQLIASLDCDEPYTSIPYNVLNIQDGEFNSYSWSVSLASETESSIFYFIIDATDLDVNLNQNISAFSLKQNYPNPFNPITSIVFDVPYYSFIKLNIYDAKGQFLEKIIENYYSSGSYKVYWDGSNYPSGIYIYEIKTDNYSLRKKMILIK